MSKINIPDDIMNVLPVLGDDIRAARKVRKMRVDDLAARMDVHRTTLMRLEAGDPGVSIGVLLRAAWILGLEDNLKDLFAPEYDAAALREQRLNLPQRVRQPKSRSLGYDDF